MILGNFHPRPEAFTLDAENEHADLVITADLTASETADAVPISVHSPARLKSLIKQHTRATVNADIASGPAKDRCGRSVWHGPGSEVGGGSRAGSEHDADNNSGGKDKF